VNVVIWGCRGSIATPGPKTIRYGGETTCIEVIPEQGKVIIIDAGSGIRKLGQKLVKDKTVSTINLLLTHSHWDHLAGFPFFLPAYSQDFSFVLGGGADAQHSVLNYLMHQMAPPYFPVDFKLLKAKFETGCCCDEGNCENSLPHIDLSIKCESIPLNHPNGGYGFKFTGKTGAFVFLTDNEIRHAHKGGLPRAEYINFCRNASLLFHDAQYQELEYEKKRGWGHSTIQDAVDLAMDAGVKRLGLFHHDPDRSDEEIDLQVEWCRNYLQKKGSSLECFACAEGMHFVV